MQITRWLSDLEPINSSNVDNDMHNLASSDYPFLTEKQVCNHIEQLSCHLGCLHNDVRVAAIEYTLYSRQLEYIQDMLTKDYCKYRCERSAPGCCNANHFMIFSLSDYMISRPTPLSMQLADVITKMQRLESEDFMSDDSREKIGHCAYLTNEGCSLRLFKSPFCIHYLCDSIHDDLTSRFPQGADDYLAAMRQVASRTLQRCADFRNPAVLEAAQAMLAESESDSGRA